MTFNSQFFFIGPIILLIIGSLFTSKLIKRRKRSPDSIYKLINDLEKKYIY